MIRRPLSVGLRLWIAALVLVLVILPLAGLALAYNFRQAVNHSFDERLGTLLNVVLAGVRYDPLAGQLVVTRSLGDARFDRVFSGWYWQASDGETLAVTSRSLWDQRLAVRLPATPGQVAFDTVGPRDTPLRAMQRPILLASLGRPLYVTVAASREEPDAEVRSFERLLGLSLLALAVLLLTGLALQIRWGLTPLRRMRAALRRVEAGDASRLDDQGLPGELADLATAMNEVIDKDQRLIERGRNAAGNLAHALKTPVAVLQTQADRLPPAQREQVRAELARIDDAVRHHLARASAAGGAALAGRTRVLPVIRPVLEGLGRLAARRGLVLETALDEQLTLRMDPQDLQELFGNLLENALGWAHTRVRVTLARNAEQGQLCIEDDGPGMTAGQREAALARGARLDEQRPGSGLGLAIVAELVTLYGGTLDLDDSPLGGLRVSISLRR
ncbi:sensor signal transduction histidine kinase [Alcanivorax sp. S71-1-4]|uniref:sensor histidine kinase n=1 Tax=Alcanivorax sp. S71-1-4 TaxID=1177159 RepID=UPI00135726F8|nr:ATP-binding protein [Alcanivorax sp. S71-1-4]KAF0809744.1 sensor signal transduction histidine kinase [Alcanivorax sp. S71-1-4]